MHLRLTDLQGSTQRHEHVRRCAEEQTIHGEEHARVPAVQRRITRDMLDVKDRNEAGPLADHHAGQESVGHDGADRRLTR